MGIDPVLSWANVYLNNYEFKCITDLIRTYKLRGRQFHSTCQFIDNFS